MTTIYVLTARDKTTYATKPTKILRAFTNEILATEAKLMIEDCEPRLEVEVVSVPLIGGLASLVSISAEPKVYGQPFAGIGVGSAIAAHTIGSDGEAMKQAAE